MELGRYLHSQREKLEITLADMAEVVRYSVSDYRKIETGQASINIHALYLACKALRCGYTKAMGLLVEDMAAGRTGPRTRQKERQ